MFQVQYVTKESLYESVQSEGDPNFPAQPTLVNQMEVFNKENENAGRLA